MSRVKSNEISSKSCYFIFVMHGKDGFTFIHSRFTTGDGSKPSMVRELIVAVCRMVECFRSNVKWHGFRHPLWANNVSTNRPRNSAKATEARRSSTTWDSVEPPNYQISFPYLFASILLVCKKHNTRKRAHPSCNFVVAFGHLARAFS